VSTQQALASPRDLEELGIARDAIQGLPLPQRKRGIKAASGILSPYLRKRVAMPLTPTLDPDDFDTSGMVGGATLAFDAGPALHARDVNVSFDVPTSFAFVGDPGITYTVDLDNGAWGSIPTNPQAFPLSGIIVIDGYTFTLTGGINQGNSFSYSTRVDSGACAATCSVAAYMLLGARGVDPATLATLKAQNDAAIAWAKDVAKGDGDLEPDADATPQHAEAGPRFTGQRTPWEWVDRRRGRDR
jgi:hypothetical protein